MAKYSQTLKPAYSVQQSDNLATTLTMHHQLMEII